MYGLMITVFLLICIALVISILLQSAKGEGLAGAFGGSSLTGTVFGGRGAATFLTRATTYLGTAFLLLALALSLMHPTTGQTTFEGGSAVEEAARENPAAPPIAPAQSGPEGEFPIEVQPAGQQATPVDELFEDQQQQSEPAQPSDSGQ